MEQNTDISITNITENITKDILSNIFNKFGQINEIVFNNFSGKAKIIFTSPESSLESIKKVNHQPILSDDLHVSYFRSAETKLKMRKWKILLRKITPTVSYDDLYSFFEKFGPIHHISYYREKRIASVQYFSKDSAEDCIQSQSKPFLMMYAWPQFLSESGHQYIEIRGLPDNYEESQLENLVKSYGKVTSISMLFYLPHAHKKTTVSFVSFETKSQRKAAIDALDSKKIDRKMIYAWRLFTNSPFNLKYSGDLSEFYYFVPIKGKHYIEFINPPDDLDEPKLRGICGRFGHVYDVSVNSTFNGDNKQAGTTSHVAFTTKGPLKKALQALSNQYEVRRLPKSSPFYGQYNLSSDDINDGSDDEVDDDD